MHGMTINYVLGLIVLVPFFIFFGIKNHVTTGYGSVTKLSFTIALAGSFFGSLSFIGLMLAYQIGSKSTLPLVTITFAAVSIVAVAVIEHFFGNRMSTEQWFWAAVVIFAIAMIHLRK